MSVRVKIPTQLRTLVGGQQEIEVDGAASLRELLAKVGAGHPELVDRVLDEEGHLRRFVNVYVGDEDVRFLEGLDTAIEESQVVSILPAVAGGSPDAGLHLSERRARMGSGICELRESEIIRQTGVEARDE